MSIQSTQKRPLSKPIHASGVTSDTPSSGRCSVFELAHVLFRKIRLVSRMFHSKCQFPRDYLHARLHRLLAGMLGFPLNSVGFVPLSVQWLSFISSGREDIPDPDVSQVIAYVFTPHLRSPTTPIFEGGFFTTFTRLRIKSSFACALKSPRPSQLIRSTKAKPWRGSIMYSSISSIELLLLALLHCSGSVHAVSGRLSRRQSSTPVALWDPCNYPSQGINGPLPCATGSECICKDDSTSATIVTALGRVFDYFT